ncbi:hypothetical protein M885DRAFT_549540 [Pelagophyceae sp. CCMP2097]|nr:hypothetical protein M885DRAFT_549540 [Pelagophyceae sp. CCMP2097]
MLASSRSIPSPGAPPSAVQAMPPLAKHSVVSQETQETAVQLDALHRAQIVYTKRIEAERIRLHQIEKKCERARRTIADFNKSLGGDYIRRERGLGEARQSNRLESQLQTVKEKQDKLQHAIKTLAVDIDNKRREKLQHDQARKHSEKRLLKRQAHLMQLNRQLQETDDEREQAGRQVENLKSEIVDEMDDFNEKISSTHNSIVAATAGGSLADGGSVATQGSGAGGAAATRARASPRQPPRPPPGGVLALPRPGHGGTLKSSTAPQAGKAPLASSRGAAFITESRPPGAADVDLQQEVNKAYWVVAKTRMDLTKQIERKEELYSAFDKICSETGVVVDGGGAQSHGGSPKHPLEQLVPLLLKSEEENYLIFRSINELNQEVEQLETEKVELEHEFELRRAADAARLHEDERLRAELGRQLAASKRLEQGHEVQHRANDDGLMQAAEAVTQLFHKFGCGETPAGEALLATGLSERNVEQFLGCIEEQLVELLQLDSHINSGEQSQTDPTRPRTPRFTKEGKRLPAMLLPDLVEAANAASAVAAGGLDSVADDADADDHIAPVDPTKWLQSLKQGGIDHAPGALVPAANGPAPRKTAFRKPPVIAATSAQPLSP